MILRTTQEQTEKNRRNKVQQEVLVRGMTNEARREKEKKKHEKETRQDEWTSKEKRDETTQDQRKS